MIIGTVNMITIPHFVQTNSYPYHAVSDIIFLLFIILRKIINKHLILYDQTEITINYYFYSTKHFNYMYFVSTITD